MYFSYSKSSDTDLLVFPFPYFVYLHGNASIFDHIDVDLSCDGGVVIRERSVDAFFRARRQDVVVQSALVIHGFGIRGFDYSRMQKPQITRENCYF
jgi:hypothetical protein